MGVETGRRLRLQQKTHASQPKLADDPGVKKTGLDRFATSGWVRFLAVAAWFVISTMAFFSRYDRMTPLLATMMASLILLVASLGLSWAAFPGVQRQDRRKRV